MTRAHRASAALMLGISITGCRHVTNPEPVHLSTPNATVEAATIVERYRNDPQLAEDLYDGNLVHIKHFRVDKKSRRFLRMKEDGYTVRLSRPSDTDEIHEGDTVKLYCEGGGLEDDKLIVFWNCRGRLED
jgi:hypothetical protein